MSDNWVVSGEKTSKQSGDLVLKAPRRVSAYEGGMSPLLFVRIAPVQVETARCRWSCVTGHPRSLFFRTVVNHQLRL